MVYQRNLEQLRKFDIQEFSLENITATENTMLSDEILLKIFSFLIPKEFKNIAMVCRAWCRVANDSSLWSVLNLTAFPRLCENPYVSMDILKKYFIPRGLKLSLSGFIVEQKLMDLIVCNCHHLHTLNLRGCNFLLDTAMHGDQRFLQSMRRVDLRDANCFGSELEDLTEYMVNLECLGLYNHFAPTISRTLFSNKSLLRVLDCSDCGWVNDNVVESIARHCPLLEYLSLFRCLNYDGHSLDILLENCRRLQTLILICTGMTYETLVSPDWLNSSITALDLRQVSSLLPPNAIADVLKRLRHLIYLRCTLSEDDIISLCHVGFPYLETLQIERRFPINIDYAADLMAACPKIKCLDISSIPFSHVHFLSFLPIMPMLRSICLSANDMSGTGFIIEALARCSRHLERLWIRHYHCNERSPVINAFIELADSCKHLQTINLSGLYVTEFLKEIELEVRSVTKRTDIQFVENEKFIIKQPEPNLDSCMKF